MRRFQCFAQAGATSTLSLSVSLLPRQAYANTQPILFLPKSLFPCVVLQGISPLLIREIPHYELHNPYMPSSDYMCPMYNSDEHTTDSPLSLKSNLNWVFLRFDMHELIMSEYSIY